MVSVSKLVNSGIILAGQSVYQDLATPEQASIEQFNIIRHLGGAAPYVQYSPAFGIGLEFPEECSIEQVQLMSRHGERYPTAKKSGKFKKAISKIKEYGKTFKGDLSFLNDYTYFVEDDYWLDRETSSENSQGLYAGTLNAMRHGAYFRSRYNDLFNENETLPIFTSNGERIYVTSEYFARGFLGSDYSKENVDYVILSEDGENGLNSLTPRHGCSTYDKKANEDLVDEFPKTYLKNIVKRWQQDNPGLELKPKYVRHFFEMCAYELNVRGQSPFCDLFTPNDFVWFGYYQDVDSYYSTGAGNNMTKLVGSVVLNASLKLLKETNQTQKIWLSFAHDSDWDIFHSALGLFEDDDLPIDKVDFDNKYKHAAILPQGARVYTEKLKCNDESYVRYIVNDAVIPIPTCSDGPGFSCKLEDFEDYINDRIGDIDAGKVCDIPSNKSQEITFYWDYQKKNYTAPLEL